MDELDTDKEKGLSSSEAKARLQKYGPNKLYEKWEVKFWDIFKEEITEPMIIFLIIVAILYSIWGKLVDTIAIFCIILALVLVEIFNEYRAKKAIASLSKLSPTKAKVIRDGALTDIDTEEVVIGDIIILVSGTKVPADAKLLESYNLTVDESSLTGESIPVELDAEADTPENAPLGERKNFVFAGTVVKHGEGKGVVVATGKNTELGKIVGIAKEIKEPKTPLQIAMKQLSGFLVWFAIFFSALIPILGIMRNPDQWKDMILTGLALSFATIPEELPIIITMALGIGGYELSKQKAIVKKARAAETLGSVTVIATDKTGTITANKMEVVRVWPEEKKVEICKAALSAMPKFLPDSTDQAIAIYAEKFVSPVGIGKILKEYGFEKGVRVRSILREAEDGEVLYSTGAPEELIEPGIDEAFASEAKKVLDEETEKGRRVIGYAVNSKFLGLISLEDPPLPEVPKAIRACHDAKIKVKMITGDYPKTAKSIAEQVGIISDSKVILGKDIDSMNDEELEESVKFASVFARTTPQHKYRIVKALQKNGEVVSVTGDGINDVLALKEADIGIAMGLRGTDVAKEAADMILADDNFATITNGIWEGRKIFDNLTKGVRYYLSCKLALVLIFLLPILINLPLPFAPIQIILLELFMDLAASATFVAEPKEKDVYKRPPRNPKEKFINTEFVSNIIVYGLSLFLAVTLCYLVGRSITGGDLVRSQTMAFSGWIFGHIFLAFTLRSTKEPLSKVGIFSNFAMIIWGVVAILTLFIIMNFTPLQIAIKIAPLKWGEIFIVILISFVCIFWHELRKIISK
ncbi:MAG TPA: cation-transporting P-type ATPase [Caldisericia bacterium]|nr:cation-transporting P-type ATPase [Caldisericia bacterium]HPO29509.1 cation-transporting P-type ATPase [Caldisericia bacterium]